MMKNEDIRELAALVREMGLTSLEYTEAGGASLKLARAAAPNAPAAVQASYWTETAGERPADAYADGLFTVSSPMVGVFYAAPSADAEPFATVGDTIREGDVLCIIEAMKIMNEITAECGGIIREVCASNKQVVEFGQPLFRIEASGE